VINIEGIEYREVCGGAALSAETREAFAMLRFDDEEAHVWLGLSPTLTGLEASPFGVRFYLPLFATEAQAEALRQKILAAVRDAIKIAAACRALAAREAA
jgi:hypothetical protein